MTLSIPEVVLVIEIFVSGEVAIVASAASGDQSRLVEHEVTSPTEDMVGMRETIA